MSPISAPALEDQIKFPSFFISFDFVNFFTGSRKPNKSGFSNPVKAPSICYASLMTIVKLTGYA